MRHRLPLLAKLNSWADMHGQTGIISWKTHLVSLRCKKHVMWWHAHRCVVSGAMLDIARYGWWTKSCTSATPSVQHRPLWTPPLVLVIGVHVWAESMRQNPAPATSPEVVANVKVGVCRGVFVETLIADRVWRWCRISSINRLRCQWSATWCAIINCMCVLWVGGASLHCARGLGGQQPPGKSS